MLKQIHVVDGVNFKANPSDELNKLETFLGLKKDLKIIFLRTTLSTMKRKDFIALTRRVA